MRSDGTKKSPVRMLVYLLLLAAVVALGYFTDIVDFTELKAVFSLKLTALLKLAVMVLLVLLVSNLVIFILHGIKPRTHRGGSCAVAAEQPGQICGRHHHRLPESVPAGR